MLFSDNNWYDYGARFYDPVVGRWHTKDPMEQYISPYVYVGNNPINMFDPSGMWGENGQSIWTKTVIDPSGNIIYHDPNDPDKNIYLSPDGVKGADGDTDGLEDVGDEKPGEIYRVGGYIRNDYENNTHEVFSSYAEYIYSIDPPIVSIYPEYELIEIFFTAGGMVLIKRGGKWLLKKFTKELAEEIAEEAIEKGIKVSVSFGNNSNQIYHAFRHTDDLGLDRALVKSSIENHFSTVSAQIIQGKPFNQIIEIGGKKIQYTAYQLKDGTINIGRIHGVN